jgi:formate dehydrogenase major subunit
MEGTNVPIPNKPDGSIVTTCAYCGVGCGFRAETRAGEVVRMIPWKDGKANHGHSCVKGRFAFDYYDHPDRVRTPLIRSSIAEPWRPVDWDTAFAHTASELKRIQTKYGTKSVGAVSSSRCTNEEIFLMQKFARVALRSACMPLSGPVRRASISIPSCKPTLCSSSARTRPRVIPCLDRS